MTNKTQWTVLPALRPLPEGKALEVVQGDEIVAHVYERRDAHLFAAASDLYAALELLASRYEQRAPLTADEEDQIWGALARARGEDAS